jgi:hypothetical protein
MTVGRAMPVHLRSSRVDVDGGAHSSPTHEEGQRQGRVNGYRGGRKPNMGYENMDVIDAFCYRLRLGEIF